MRAIIVLAVIAVISFFVYRAFTPLGKFERHLKGNINRQLAYSGHAVRRYVEGKHVSVNVKKAKVTSIDVETIDGSYEVGEYLENILWIKVRIKTRWDGVFHKDGYTTCEIETKFKDGKETESIIKIIDSDAVFQNGDVWLQVGLLGLEAMLESY